MGNDDHGGKVKKSDEEWQASLSPSQYQVLRCSGTERAFTGPFWNDHDAATYQCAGCGAQLFDSDTKYDSGSGWPSFYQPVEQGAVEEIVDDSHGMSRTEVRCARCAGHLGHVFHDGPRPTGLRYCINGTALKKTAK